MFTKNLTLLLVFLYCGTAFAAHPLITDDTGTQGKGKSQVEFNAEYGHECEEGLTTSTAEIAAILSYGLMDDIDIVFGIPYKYINKDDSETTATDDGISDISNELKWRFYEQNGLSFALKPGISLPTGDDKKGLGAGKTAYSAFFITTKESNPWLFHLNLGYTRNENRVDERKDVWHASLAAELKIAEGLKAVANIGAKRNTDKSSNTGPAFILGGIVYSIRENFDVDFGVKRGLNKP